MPNEVYRLTLTGLVAGQRWTNVLHWIGYPAGGADPFAGASQLVELVWTDLLPAYVACMPANSVVTNFGARRLLPAGGPSVYPNGFATEPGTRPSSASSSAVCPIISMPVYGQVATALRWSHGRIYLPGVGDADLTDNVYSIGLVAALDSLCAQLSAGYFGATYSYVLGVYSASQSHIVRATQIVPSPYPGIQRRRAPRSK